MLGLWLTARSVNDSSFLERELPWHENEKPPPTPKDKFKQIRESMQEEQGNISEAFSGPAHYGKRYGFAHILGEPPEKPKPKVLTAEELRQVERQLEADFFSKAQAEIDARKTR